MVEQSIHQFQNDVRLHTALRTSEHVSQAIQADLGNIESFRAFNYQNDNGSANAHLPQIELLSENRLGLVSPDQAAGALRLDLNREQRNAADLVSGLPERPKSQLDEFKPDVFGPFINTDRDGRPLPRDARQRPDRPNWPNSNEPKIAMPKDTTQPPVSLTPQERDAILKAMTKEVKRNPDGTTVTTFRDGSVVTTDKNNEVIKEQNADGTGFCRMPDGSTHHWGPKAQDNYDETKSGDNVVRKYTNGCLEETDLRTGKIKITLPVGWGESNPDVIYINAKGESQYVTTYFHRQLTNPDFGQVKQFGSAEKALEDARKRYIARA